MLSDGQREPRGGSPQKATVLPYAAAVHPKAERLQSALADAGVRTQVHELSQSTRTAPEAAAAVGVEVGQIVKSLVFLAGDKTVVALVSGGNRASPQRLADEVGGPLVQADARTVKERTGFTIGGVPPLGHREQMEFFFDQDLLQYAEIWAAAGTPNALFRLGPAELPAMTGGRVAAIT